MIITTEKDRLCLALHGREQLWALRAKIAVPRQNILSMRFEPTFQEWRRVEMRLPGSKLPGRLLAGSYWTEEGWDFLYIKYPHGFFRPKVDDVLVIETDQNRYRRIIVSYNRDEARKLMIWWGKNKRK